MIRNLNTFGIRAPSVIGLVVCRSTNSTANVKCYVTYVTRLPTGREEGQFLALDLGGTNFRVILAELHTGSRSVRMKCHKHEVSFLPVEHRSCNRVGTPPLPPPPPKNHLEIFSQACFT